jgi:wobble nucleotide-excising tRNase
MVNMFKKIEYIKGYGKFTDFSVKNCDWNGNFKRTTIIYAPNGSGKTSLSLMFRSIKGNNEIISKKRTFGITKDPEILLISDNGKEVKFSKRKWNTTNEKIEIFDSFYTEDNIYIITMDNDPNKMNLFELSIENEIKQIMDEIKHQQEEKRKYTAIRRSIKYRIKAGDDTKETAKYFSTLLPKRQKAEAEIEKLEALRIEKTKAQRQLFLEKINCYLSVFSADLKLTELTQKKRLIVYGLSVNGNIIRTDEDNLYSLKYSLSEGDKNALALSFFLAKLEMIGPSFKDYCVIIDDPFTSFDHHRKLSTVINISKISRKANQLIVLTHDLYFARELSQRIDEDKLVLQIKRNGNGSEICNFDIEKAALTGISKDIFTLHQFLKKGASNEFELREIVRCIRPAIEGMFRIKYFDIVNENQWLGDFIKMIHDAKEGDAVYRLKPLMDEISEINDYSKAYHHSNPSCMDTPINSQELELYTRRTIELIRKM